MSCSRTQEFLANGGHEAKEEVNAKKVRYQRAEALELAAGAKEIYVAKGKKVVHFDMKKAKPDDDTLAKHLLGPTGNLRAPALKIGKLLIVGFNADAYQELLG